MKKSKIHSIFLVIVTLMILFNTSFADNTTCTYSISPTSNSFSSSGGTGSVSVTADAGCDWGAVSSDSWIHITSGSSGSGNGTIEYSVDVNAGRLRSGTIGIGINTTLINTFTIRQDGITCYCEIGDPGPVVYDASGGAGSVSVTADDSCDWRAVSNNSWIHITAGASGSGNGTVEYSVDKNGGLVRVGTIIIGGREFTVSQNYADWDEDDNVGCFVNTVQY